MAPVASAALRHARPASATVVRFAPPVIGRGEIDDVVAALESGWFSTGRLARGMFPEAERVSDQILSLPFGGGMTDDEAWTVVDVLRRAIPGRTR